MTITFCFEKGKKKMEHRYGVKQLETLVDDIQTASWMGQHIKLCPHSEALLAFFSLKHLSKNGDNFFRNLAHF